MNKRYFIDDEDELIHLIQYLGYENFSDHFYNKLHKFLLRRRSPRFRYFNINALDTLGNTAVSSFLKNETEGIETGPKRIKTAVVILLINCGADVHIRVASYDGCMNSMLHIACEKNNPLQIILTLLNKGLAVNDLNDQNQTALHFASNCINVETMSLLIEHGADVNAIDINGDTPLTFLFYAFANVFRVTCKKKLSNIETCLDLLLHNGANINHIPKYGITCFFRVITGLSSMAS